MSGQRLSQGDLGVVPMSDADERNPFVNIRLVYPNGKKSNQIMMLLDTGSGALLSFTGWSVRVYADLDHVIERGASVSASGSIRPTEYARLNFDLDFGGIVARRLMAIVRPEQPADLTAIGGDFMRRFKVSIDPVGGLARFELPDDEAEIVMPVWRVHGFSATIIDQKQTHIHEVIVGSQAEFGGLRAGDIILGFDGKPLSIDEPIHWPLPVLDNSLTHRVFEIERDGDVIELTLGLQEMIPTPRVFNSTSGDSDFD